MSASTRLGVCNCFAARQAARHLTRLYEKHLEPAELTSAQFSILVLIDELEHPTMSELAKELVMDRTTLLRAIKPLQRDHLVKSDAHPEDSRQLAFALTPAGEKRLKLAARLWQNAQAAFEAEVGPSVAARMRRDLLALARAD